MEKRHWAKVLASPFTHLGIASENIEITALDLTVDYLKLYVKFWSEREAAQQYMTS